VEGKAGQPCGYVCEECAASPEIPAEEEQPEPDEGNLVADTESDAEVKWGASIDKLTESGTLKAALAAAKDNSEIKYIQLQKSFATSSIINILGGEFTIDLGGCTLTGSSNPVIYINSSDAVVTFADSGTGGKIVNTTDAAFGAVKVQKGKAIFTGGSYEGSGAVYIEKDGTVEITGGIFTATNNRAVRNGGILNICGGTFTAGSNPYLSGVVCTSSGSITTITGGTYQEHPPIADVAVEYLTNIQYYGGTLYLQNYNGATPLTDLTISNFVNTFAVTDNLIQLPTGYEFYLNDDAEQNSVTELEKDKTYGIKYTGSESEIASVSITWGAMNFTYSDGTWNTETYTYDGAGWTAEGNTVTVENTGNVDITASVAYQNRSDFAFIATWDKETAPVPANSDPVTFTLDLIGKPKNELSDEIIGDVTVRIDQ